MIYFIHIHQKGRDFLYWTRDLLKRNAKQVLTKNYWRAFVICLLCSVLGAGVNNLSITANFLSSYPNSTYYYYFYDLNQIVVGVIAFVIFSIGLIWLLFISGPMAVARNRYMMESRCGTPPFSSLFSVFNNHTAYFNVVKVQFLCSLEIFAWSLLCFFPGIYKSYQLHYVPYLLAENPYLSYSRAKELSIAMTNGEKFDIFVLDFSFFGWRLLGTLLIVGNLFVDPYYYATFAELYAASRTRAMDQNLTNSTELSGFISY